MLSFLSTGIMGDPKTGIPFICSITSRDILLKLLSDKEKRMNMIMKIEGLIKITTYQEMKWKGEKKEQT